MGLRSERIVAVNGDSLTVGDVDRYYVNQDVVIYDTADPHESARGLATVSMVDPMLSLITLEQMPSGTLAGDTIVCVATRQEAVDGGYWKPR